MANSGFWTAGLEGTVDNLNATLFQKGAEADFDVTKTGLTFLETASGKIKRSNGTSWDVVVDVDPTAGAGGLRTLGVGAQQAAAGDHTHTLLHDTLGSSESTVPYTATHNWNCSQQSVTAGGDLDLLSITLSCIRQTVIEAACGGAFYADSASSVKIRLFIDGVQVAESAYITTAGGPLHVGNCSSVSSGSRIVKMTMHNYATATAWVDHMSFVFGGCLKI